MKKSSTKIKYFSITILTLFTALAVTSVFSAANIPTNYAMDQFLPRKHALLNWDKESKKVFHISEGTPHILLLSLKESDQGQWYDKSHLAGLQKLTEEIASVRVVQSVLSLGNVQSAFEKKDELLVAPLPDLRKAGFNPEAILQSGLYTPNLISADGRHTALFVTPGVITQDEHTFLMRRMQSLAQKNFPNAKVQIGGPAAIRNQLIGLLSREILLFIILALVCSVCVLKIMFQGNKVLGQVAYILVIANALALGVMRVMNISFNVLSSTLPVLVTVSSLGICAHLLVRMSEAAERSFEERVKFLKELMKEISLTIIATGLSTSVGFACLIPSDVPIISQYGLAVALGVMISATATLILVPTLFLMMPWPKPRPLLYEPKRWAYFLVRKANLINPVLTVLTVVLAAYGTQLSWTSRLFDDLPANHSARRSTDLIARKLGGVSNVDIIIGSSKNAEIWKKPENLKRLDHVARELRSLASVGSVVTLADFMGTGETKTQMPKNQKAIAEMQFLYSMSGDSPLKQFLSDNEKWTRMALRLPDLPADKNQKVVKDIRRRVSSQFPGLDVKVAGFGAMVPQMNRQLSLELMWGFFEALFWIVLMMAVIFRSLRWALVGVVPNLIPPAVLLGFLALFDVPIKPGIAIIFSITLGIAFDNTIYILGRLKHMLKEKPRTKKLPIYTLLKRETMPCLVSSLCLFAGFTIFLFSVFPVNKMFGAFVMLAIIAGLLADLVWLPAILKAFPWLLLDSSSPETIKTGRPGLKETVMRRLSPILMLLALGLIAFHKAYAFGATKNVKEVLSQVEKNAAPPNERVVLKMIIQESDGSKKERVLSITRKNEGESRALIRLNQPADLKGLSLLTVASSSGEDQWLYLPSDKKSRRILGSNKKGKFLDSEIAYEDLRAGTYKEFNNRILKDDGKVVQIESKARPGSESSYGRMLTWISAPDYKVDRVEYFDKAGRLLKRAEFKDYKRVGNTFWRAREVNVVNVQAKRKTRLLLQDVSVKKIPDDEVSLSALEE